MRQDAFAQVGGRVVEEAHGELDAVGAPVLGGQDGQVLGVDDDLGGHLRQGIDGGGIGRIDDDGVAGGLLPGGGRQALDRAADIRHEFAPVWVNTGELLR